MRPLLAAALLALAFPAPAQFDIGRIINKTIDTTKKFQEANKGFTQEQEIELGHGITANILGSTMGNAAEYAEVVRRLGRGELRPMVDRVFPLARARDAYERLRKGEQLGKVVIEI